MKRTKSHTNKIKIDITDLFFDRKPIIKNSSYYTKLYSSDAKELNDKNPSYNSFFQNNTLQPHLSHKHKILSLKKVFNQKNSKNLKIKWPKITHPKWPFSKKNDEPKDFKKMRIFSSRPSQKYHNFNTIKWLTQKYSDSVKEKSIYSLLPNNGKPIVPEYENEFNKRHREMMEYLESFKGPGGREKFVNINPKYFYNNSTFKKILRLREMFLEIDKRGNHKMLLKELVQLFKENNINVDIKELKNLFLKNVDNKKKKSESANLLYLDFYEFMNFALSRDQDFRLFMREIKRKNKMDETNRNSKTISYDEKKENIYIPMNFDLIFNYFINKEKQRNSITIVENAIKEMDKIIQERFENQNQKEESAKMAKTEKQKTKKKYTVSKTLKDKNLNFLSFNNYHRQNTISEEQELDPDSLSINKSSKSTKKMHAKLNEMIEKEKEEKLKKINFAQLIKEFSNLFGIKENDEKNKINEDKNKNRILSADNSKMNSYSNYYNNYNNYCNNYNNNNYETINNNNNRKEKTYSEEVKKGMRIDSLKNININNFEKYHDLKLALSVTKEQIKNMKNRDLIDEDLKTFNIVDVRDIINKVNTFIKSPKSYKEKNNYTNTSFPVQKYLNNLDNSLKKDKYYLNNKTEYNNNKTNAEENTRNKFRKYHIKKNIYNYYCGKPIIMDYINNSVKKTKLSRHDYVPNEFFAKGKD